MPPRAGILSRMAITWSTALAILLVGLAVPSMHPIFAGPPSAKLVNLLLLSVGLMAVHKVECYATREWEQCPVYLGIPSARWARGVRETAFVVFCSLDVAYMLLIALALRGPPWTMLVMAILCAQGLHELHHPAKSLARRRYYPGTASAVLFVLFMDLWFAPEYFAQLRLPFAKPLAWYYLAQPVVLLAFWLEDRAWLAAWPRREGLGGGPPSAPRMPGARPSESPAPR
jgi:hypothetical protein